MNKPLIFYVVAEDDYWACPVYQLRLPPKVARTDVVGVVLPGLPRNTTLATFVSAAISSRQPKLIYGA